MKKGRDVKVFNAISYTVIAVISLLCLIPFLLVLMGSITDEQEIIQSGFSLFPNSFSLEAY